MDYTRLNRFVPRPTHPTRTPRDAVTEIDSEANFFTCFDAANSYYQIPLHPSSQILTTFMTPRGRFKFLGASMGLSCSGNEYNRRHGFLQSNQHVACRRRSTAFVELLIRCRCRQRPVLASLISRNPYIWTIDQEMAFEAVKAALLTVLTHFNPLIRPSRWMHREITGWGTLSSKSTTNRFIDANSRWCKDTEYRYAAADGYYTALKSKIESGFPESRDQTPASVATNWGIRDQLTVDDGIVVFSSRIVIP